MTKKTLSLVESVRLRPGMYFGDVDSCSGANSVVYELVSNVVDHFLAGRASFVRVVVDGHNIYVEEDGPGLPFAQPSPNDKSDHLAEHCLLRWHETATADGHAPHVHVLGGCFGLAVLNAGAASLDVVSKNGSAVYRQTFVDGRAQTKSSVAPCTDAQGTKVHVQLSKEVFGHRTPHLPSLRRTLFEVAHFYPGLVVELQDERFVSRWGLLDLAFALLSPSSAQATYPPPPEFSYSGILDGVQLQVAAVGEAKKTAFRSWVNGLETEAGGAHVNALKRALAKVDWTPAVALVQVIMHRPEFAGPTKSSLKSRSVAPALRKMLVPALEAFTSSTEPLT